MFRFAPALAFVGLLAGTGTALSADYDDYPEFFREGYKTDWDLSDAGDPLDFELGIRYSYSYGSTQVESGGDTYTSTNTAHAVELHGRIDDNSTGTYLKVYGGMTGLIYGEHNTPQTGGNDVTIDAGQLSYFLADFGYLGLGTDNFGFGPFIGYQYQRENTSTTTPDQTFNADYNMLRMGFAARAEVGDSVDLTAEAALIPYARMGGSISNGGPSFDAQLVGASGEVMLGFHPLPDMVVRAGARALYLTDTIGSNSGDNHTMMRTSGLVELTYAF